MHVTIVDDESTPILTLRLDPDDIGEQGGTAAVAAQLDHPSRDKVLVTVAAAATDRYVPAGFRVSAGPVLTIDARATTHTGTVTITAVPSNHYTGDRKVRVTGTPASPGSIGMEIAPAEPAHPHHPRRAVRADGFAHALGRRESARRTAPPRSPRP